MTFITGERPRPGVRLARQVPVALALAVLAVAVVGMRPAVIVPLYLAVVTAELCRTDVAAHRLPNAIVLPGYGFAAVGLVWEWAATGRVPWQALGVGAAFFGFLLLMNLAGGMGMGDVKLAGVLGLGLGAVGVTTAAAAMVIGFVAGGAAGVLALLAPGGLLRRIPFGPFLLFGFWSALSLSGMLEG